MSFIYLHYIRILNTYIQILTRDQLRWQSICRLNFFAAGVWFAPVFLELCLLLLGRRSVFVLAETEDKRRDLAQRRKVCKRPFFTAFLNRVFRRRYEFLAVQRGFLVVSFVRIPTQWRHSCCWPDFYSAEHHKSLGAKSTLCADSQPLAVFVDPRCVHRPAKIGFSYTKINNFGNCCVFACLRWKFYCFCNTNAYYICWRGVKRIFSLPPV